MINDTNQNVDENGIDNEWLDGNMLNWMIALAIVNNLAE